MRTIPVLDAKTSYPKAIDTDVITVFARSAKSPYGKLLERLLKEKTFSGKHGSAEYIRFGGKQSVTHVLFLGMGPLAELTTEKARSMGGTAWKKLVAKKSKIVAIPIDSIPIPMIRALAEGLMLGAYRFDKYKTVRDEDSKNKYFGPSRIYFLAKDQELYRKIKQELVEVQKAAEAINITRDWSNEPSNFGTPEYYASEAQRIAKESGLRCQILKKEDSLREKMKLFLGVGQGSVREGRIVVLEYIPKTSDSKMKTIALVGKGITFDSGGISIKPSLRMEEMKHDMTGAATIMGAIQLAAQWRVPNRVIAILAFTENMPDGNAIQPGNIIQGRAGKTVEIINTDAEGRLILADVLDYAQDFKPDAVIDVATLTGAVSIALGKYCCGILGNDESLIRTLQQAGQQNGERIWELPLFDEYFEDLKSDSADMKNSANDSYGGTIRGAIFLKQFIKKGTKWAHLDIAATASGLGHLPYYPKKGASGAYVRTLAQFARDYR